MSSLRDYDPTEAGWIYIDANIFIHVLLNDPRFGATCKAFLTRVEKGDAEACLSPLGIDEIAYKIITEKLKTELAWTPSKCSGNSSEILIGWTRPNRNCWLSCSSYKITKG